MSKYLLGKRFVIRPLGALKKQDRLFEINQDASLHRILLFFFTIK